jgi:hypothetical protein
MATSSLGLGVVVVLVVVVGIEVVVTVVVVVIRRVVDMYSSNECGPSYCLALWVPLLPNEIVPIRRMQHRLIRRYLNGIVYR